MFYIYISKMKINKKIIVFTYDFPTGNSENTFIKFEISKLLQDFNEVEIIPEKKLNFKKKNNSKINVDFGLSNKINIINIIYNFFSYTIFSINFYREIKKIIFQKNFFLKCKFAAIEITKSEIAYRWIKKYKINDNKNVIFYSFWSNFILISFEKIKKFKNIKTISRVLGSDLNGYIKDDNYVPYIQKKFYSLNKLFYLAKFQKKILLKKKLIKKTKLNLSPLGIYENRIQDSKNKINTINFLSCNSFIKIKNTLLMIDVVKKFSEVSKKKVNYYIIGDGEEKKAIKSKLLDYKKYFTFFIIKKVEDLPKFIKKKNIHFFLNLSSQEGMSFSIMEALSCGTPVICSNIEANKNLVNKSRGYILDINNFEKSLNHVSQKLISDLKFKKKYLSKKKNAKYFISKNLINQKCYLNFYNQIKRL